MRLGTSKIEWGSPAYSVLAGMTQEIMNIPQDKRTVSLANIRQDRLEPMPYSYRGDRICVKVEVRFFAEDFDPTRREQPPTLAQGQAQDPSAISTSKTNGQPTT